VHVARLILRDFRNYERAEVALGAGLNVVVGANGAGKTNMLEALYFGLTAQSCRTSNAREIVRVGASVARVEVHVQAEDGLHALEVGVEPGVEKVIRVDGARLVAGVDPPRPLVSVFLPDRLDLVKGAPAGRRAHIDRVVVALWPARAGTRSAYARALAQRNALIGRVRAGAAGPDLLGLPEPAELRYAPRCAAAEVEAIQRELREHRESDLDRGFTTHGPHRDDIALVHGGRLMRTLGSQGQQRIALLALLFAERDALAARGAAPLMLLDDVMSELDLTRRERLSELVAADGQTVITATEPEHVPGAEHGATVIAVTAGTVTESSARAAA